MKSKIVCLNMIVKDESHVIERCLRSVRDLIDYWVIADTGSTDGTQKIIADVLKGIPGELHEHPWENFEVNRNRVLDLSLGKSDYILFIDADDFLVNGNKIDKQKLCHHNYRIEGKSNGLIHYRPFLILNSPEWRWKGVLHEDVYHSKSNDYAMIPEIYIEYTNEGTRGKNPAQRHLDDRHLLEEAVRNNPGNTRYLFALALLYLTIGEKEKALEYFEKRAAIQNDLREVFWSLLQTAKLKEDLGESYDAVVGRLCEAYTIYPKRAEALAGLILKFMEKKQFLMAYFVAKKSLAIPKPSDGFLVESRLYDYWLLVQFAECAYQIGRYEEAIDAMVKLLAIPTLPENIRKDLNEKFPWLKNKAAANGMNLQKAVG